MAEAAGTLGIRERIRLAALASYGILDTDPEPEFDRFVRRAAERFGTPISSLSLVDEHRQWFKARTGLAVRETGRQIAFCHHAVASGAPLVVPDARLDPRFSSNPLVIGGQMIRFYAGAPLSTPLGRTLGTLNVIDTRPRATWSDRDTAELVGMAAEAMALLEQRRGALVRHRALRERTATAG